MPLPESLLNKLATTAKMFSCEFCEIFKISFFKEHLRWLYLNSYHSTGTKSEKLIICNIFDKEIEV